jgi:hypothetical protein
MSVDIATMAYSSAKWFSRFSNCIDQLTWPEVSVKVVATQSYDGTEELLHEWFNHMHSKHRAHQVTYVKDLSENRFEKMAKLRNMLLAMCQEADHILMIDSDLVNFPKDLIERLQHHKKDIIAPMIHVENSEQFYDAYSFRLRGQRFDILNPGFPFVPREIGGTEPIELTSVGSCYLMRGELVRSVRYSGRDVSEQVLFCEDALKKDYRIWVDHADPKKYNVPH